MRMNIRRFELLLMLLLLMMVLPSCRSHREAAVERVHLTHWDEWKYNLDDTLLLPSILFQLDSPQAVPVVRHSRVRASRSQDVQDTTARVSESATRVGTSTFNDSHKVFHIDNYIFRLVVCVIGVFALVVIVRWCLRRL